MLKKLAGLFSKTPEPETPSAPAERIDGQKRRLLLKQAYQALSAADQNSLIEVISILLKADKKDPEAIALDGIRLFLQGELRPAAALLESAIELHTSEPHVYKILAECYQRLGAFGAGIAVSEKAVELAPQDPEALHIRGLLFIGLQDYENAALYLNRSLEFASDELSLQVLANLFSLEIQGRALLRKSLVSERAAQVRRRQFRRLSTLRRQRELSGDESLAFMALGLDAEHVGSVLDEARRIFDKPLAAHNEAAYAAYVFMLAGDIPKSLEMWEQLGEDYRATQQYTIGIVRAAAGGKEWSRGWRMMSEGLAFKALHATQQRGLPAWKGGRLGGKKLLVYQDQGFGDNLIALRFIRHLERRGIAVVFACFPGMEEMVAGCGLSLEVISATAPQDDPKVRECAAAIALFDLVHVLGLTAEELKDPVLIKAEAGLCERWVKTLDTEPGLKVGIVTCGNPWRQDDWLRTVPSSALEPLRRLKNVTWVNLAVDPRPEREQLVKMLGALDPVADFESFSHTAAVIDRLDVVVAIDCSVAHLAGALGKKVLVLAPTSVDWRWRVGNDTQPFWPSSEVFSAEAPGQWGRALKALATRLGDIGTEAARDQGRGIA